MNDKEINELIDINKKMSFCLNFCFSFLKTIAEGEAISNEDIKKLLEKIELTINDIFE